MGALKEGIDQLISRGKGMLTGESPDDFIVYQGGGAKYDQWDRAMIGTGQGDQWYGFGPYAAQLRGTANWYADEAGKKSGQQKYIDKYVESALNYNHDTQTFISTIKESREALDSFLRHPAVQMMDEDEVKVIREKIPQVIDGLKKTSLDIAFIDEKDVLDIARRFAFDDGMPADEIVSDVIFNKLDMFRVNKQKYDPQYYLNKGDNLFNALRKSQAALKENGIGNIQYQQMKKLVSGMNSEARQVVDDFANKIFWKGEESADLSELTKLERKVYDATSDYLSNNIHEDEYWNIVSPIAAKMIPKVVGGLDLNNEIKNVTYYRDTVDKIIDSVGRSINIGKSGNSFLHKIKIPGIDKERMLMWDYSLKDQPKILNAVDDLLPKVMDQLKSKNPGDAYESLADTAIALNHFKENTKITPQLRAWLKQIGIRDARKDHVFEGAETFQDLPAGFIVRLMEHAFDPPTAAKMMSDSGISGTAHWNQRTRQAMRGKPTVDLDKSDSDATYNYSFFDDVDIKVLSRDQISGKDPMMPPELIKAMIASGYGYAGAGILDYATDTDINGNPRMSLGDTFMKSLEVLDVPQQLLQGAARTGYGMLTGEDLTTALKAGERVVTTPVDENAKAFSDLVFDKTGSPVAATAANVAGQLLAPF